MSVQLPGGWGASVTVNKQEGKLKGRSTSVCRWTSTTRQSKESEQERDRLPSFFKLFFFLQENNCQNGSAACNAIYCKFYMEKKSMPLGVFIYQENPTCDPAIIVASLKA